jgi:hypothetical protein
VEYDQPEHGNENHQTPETEDTDECETFAKADLDMPKWSNWENEDRNIDEGVLSQWLDLSNWRNELWRGRTNAAGTKARMDLSKHLTAGWAAGLK